MLEAMPSPAALALRVVPRYADEWRRGLPRVLWLLGMMGAQRGVVMGQSGLVRYSDADWVHTSTGKVSGCRMELWHSGLNEHRLLRAPDRDILQNKVHALVAAWDEKWDRVSSKQSAPLLQFKGKYQAEARTQDAQRRMREAEEILMATLIVNDAVDWTSLEDHRPFKGFDASAYPEVTCTPSGEPMGIKSIPLPVSPDPQHWKYQPPLGMFDRLIPSRKAAKLAEGQRLYAAAYHVWKKQESRVEEATTAAKRQFEKATAAYSAANAAFESGQEQCNAKVRDLAARYITGDMEAVLTNAELILNASRYPDWLRKDFSVQYNPEPKVLAVEFQLPTRDDIPRLAKVSYVASRDEMKESFLAESAINRLFDSVIYQLALRTIHEMFEGDTANALDSVVFNGWVTSVNRSTGHDETGCIMSIHASKDEFLAFDLSRVEPKACFKQLRGVAASKLSGLTPVAPLMRLDMNDPRFVATHEVAAGLQEGTNLAAIDWQEFEHLVRELFEREFASGGGEVKVTRASADGGVDAVVFDPDPIRGGKIIIQAKRYTNTVGVSAVRDLFGTMMNEGAMKGLLVTTSDYGPDAYAFARDKPITLLNGSNLLHLLSKHGHKARIDLPEARRLREGYTSSSTPTA
jgi:restriction system protein